MSRPITIVKRFLSRYLFTANHAVRISLHLANSSETQLFSKSFDDDSIDEVKPQDDAGRQAYADLIDEYVSVIKEAYEDEDDDDDSEGFILRAELRDKTEVCSAPIRPKSHKNLEKALLTQAHRHLEKALEYNHKMVDSVMRHGTNQMHHVRLMHDESFEVRSRLLKTEQDLADRSHERMLEAKKEQQSQEFKQTIMNGVSACFPMLAGKVMGIMPVGAEAVRSSPHYQTLKSLFENVPEQRWPEMQRWLQSVPLETDAERTAFNHVIDSVLNDMIVAEKEKKTKETSNGKEPPIRH